MTLELRMSQLAAEFSEIHGRQVGDVFDVNLTFTVDAAVEKLALAVYMDGSKSMLSSGNYGRGGGILAHFGRQRNPVQEVMRAIVPHLATLDATQSCRVAYWATGQAGTAIEVIGEMTAQQAESAEFPGPREFGDGTHLLPAIRDFVGYVQGLMNGGEVIHVAFGVIVTDGLLHDAEEAIGYTRDALIPAIQSGKFPKTVFTTVGVGPEVSEEQLEELEHQTAPEGFAEHTKGVFCYALADQISQVPQLVSHLLDANAPAFYGGAVIRDQNGAIVATYEDMVPVVVDFKLPVMRDTMFFTLEASGRKIEQRLKVVEEQD